MGYLGRMSKSRSGYKGDAGTPGWEPDNRFYRRHGRLFNELKMRTDAKKAAMMRKQAENPRLVRFNFLHHNL